MRPSRSATSMEKTSDWRWAASQRLRTFVAGGPVAAFGYVLSSGRTAAALCRADLGALLALADGVWNCSRGPSCEL